MKKITTFLIVGAAVGAAVWFFNTPKGKEVLNSIKDGTNDLADQLKDRFNSAKDAAGNLVKKGKQYANEMNGRVQESNI